MKAIRIFAVVLCCALIFSFNVSAADNISISFQGIYDNSYGNRITELNNPTFQYDTPLLKISGKFDNNTVYSFAISVNDNNVLEDLNIVKAIVSNESLISYQPLTGQNITDYSYNNVFYTDSNKTIIITFNTSNLNFEEIRYIYFQFEKLPSQIPTSITVSSYFEIENDSNELVISNSINSKLDNVSSSINKSINEAADRIESSVNNIDTDSIIQILENIYNYGNTYNQIDQNIINGLGSAEDQLSNAEDAIENKSRSLVNKVASQWTANKGVASSFLTTITPATSAIGTVTNNFFEAIPEEIKNAVITIMLIVFIGWLIGRVEG